MNNKLIILVGSIALMCILSTVYGFMTGNMVRVAIEDSWSARDYVANRGDCFVPPQGDPLYDEHYAKNVNTYNCDALRTQSESKNIDAQTRDKLMETNTELFGLLFFVFLIMGVIAFFIYAIAKGGTA